MCLGLLCLTSHSTKIQLYRGREFYWWRQPEVPGIKQAPTCRKLLTNERERAYIFIFISEREKAYIFIFISLTNL